MMSRQKTNQRYPSSHRLLRSEDYDLVFSENEFKHRNSSLLFLAKANQQGFNRLGVVVSKKNVPLAVDRNSIKRQIRECFRRLPGDRDSGRDVVVLVRPAARTADNLKALLESGFEAVLMQDRKA